MNKLPDFTVLRNLRLPLRAHLIAIKSMTGINLMLGIISFKNLNMEVSTFELDQVDSISLTYLGSNIHSTRSVDTNSLLTQNTAMNETRITGRKSL